MKKMSITHTQNNFWIYRNFISKANWNGRKENEKILCKQFLQIIFRYRIANSIGFVW